VSRGKAGGADVRLTDRAVRDLQQIEAYSIEQWGRKAAAKYIAALEAGLERLQQMPSLLRQEPDLHPSLRFFRVNKHLLVCDFYHDTILVLTVIHASKDIPSRLGELEPTLAAEVGLLHRKLHSKK